VLINDPIVMKLEENRYWLSIADSNIWFWAKAIAAERKLDVRVSEPDASPLAVQGPKAEDVVAAIFGNWIRELKYFWFRDTQIDGIPVLVARSGWSKQGGFEIYLKDANQGTKLWNLVKEAGKAWDIGPGNPNLCERVESGLLSYGGDTDAATNPFEVRLGKYIDLDVDADVIGIPALRQIKARGIQRHQLGVMLEGDRPIASSFGWRRIIKDGQHVGEMTNGVWSWRLKRNIGFALIAITCKAGETVTVIEDNRPQLGKLVTLPFL
jgi:aminomethyltransferase